ncbi:hypothetical protein [Phycicoccus avicenniae]|uniref:hypothetical protein n=1 Tax=Phycicoccus avicenniae TaxID=2828860 RepID=UPI003D2E11E5
MLGLSNAPGLLLQLVHVVPPLVGLVLVARVRTTRRWRTWALLSFGLSSGLALLSTLLSVAVVSGFRPGGSFQLYGILSAGLGLLSLVAAGLGVAAVVADRTDDAPAPGAPPVQPYPPAR